MDTLIVPADFFLLQKLRAKHGKQNPNILNRRYELTKSQFGKWEFKLLCFDTRVKYLVRSLTPSMGDGCTSEMAIEDVKKLGFQSGAIGHLLIFADRYPEERFKYPIVALGSAINLDAGGSNNGDAPFLVADDERDRPRVGLGWFSVGWKPSCRFLAVRKLKEDATE